MDRRSPPDRKPRTLIGTAAAVEDTRLARTVFSNVGFPAGPTDSILRQIQDLRVESRRHRYFCENPQPAIRAIELIQANTLQLAIFANGTMQQTHHNCGEHARRSRRIPG